MAEQKLGLKLEIKPCPFCGTDLSSKNFPQVMTVVKVYSDEYLTALITKGKLLSSENYYNGACVHCGARGPRAVIKEETIKAWNTRNENSKISENKGGSS